jgi:DNA polymerase (family 10)
MNRYENRDIAAILDEMAVLYEMEEVSFKPQAYENAANAVRSYARELADVYREGGTEALDDIRAIGESIAEHIESLLTEGTFEEYERLKTKYPVDAAELTAINGVGPQTVKALWDDLGIRTVVELEQAARAGSIAQLDGFGETTQENILDGIAFFRTTEERTPLGEILATVREIKAGLRGITGITHVAVAGSVRRRSETVGDIDILATASGEAAVMQQFTQLQQVTHVHESGDTKTSIRLHNGLDVDLRIVPAESWGAALNYFTGSKEHTVALREIAIAQEQTLSEYGLFAGDERVAGETEKELYAALGLDYVEPELREQSGEIEAAREDTLPELIGYSDIRGDLQVQTNWTDGEHSPYEMAVAAAKRGLEYIAVTDHTQSLQVANGANEEQLKRQIAAIAELNEQLQRDGYAIAVLTGAEVNIEADGSLDIADEVLAQLDIVGAGVHSSFDLEREKQTRRVIAAMENPHVDILFHPTARLLRTREPIALHMESIFDTAKRTGTVLEIDAYPDRLDLRDTHIRRCVEEGIPMAINSDAHAVHHFDLLEFGIAQARRGWAERRHIINTWPKETMLSYLKNRS